MRNTIQNFFKTTNIRVAGAKFCVAMAMLFGPVFLMGKEQYLDHLPAYLLTSAFITIPFLIQSFTQLGRAFRASPNKWVGVILGCMVFGLLQASIYIFILVFGALFLVGTLNFSSASKVVNTMSAYIKESFALNPQARKKESSDAVERHLQTLSHAATKGKNATAKAAPVPVLGTAGIPENITDYASYLENLSKK